MKTKWYKPLITILTLMFCMSVLYVPAFAVEEPDEEQEATALFDEQEDIEEIDDLPVVVVESTPEIEEFPDYSQQGGLPDSVEPRPFTPSGTSTVVDNTRDSDGKEFYTITTEDGDIFYLIIDRQRNTHNVYFLNAVTELDLLALAAKNERDIPAGIASTPPAPQPNEDTTEQGEAPEPAEPPVQPGNTTLYIILAVVVLGVGGAAYYFKIVKGRSNMADDDDFGDDDDTNDDDNEYGYEDEPDGNDDPDGEAEDGGDR